MVKKLVTARSVLNMCFLRATHKCGRAENFYTGVTWTAESIGDSFIALSIKLK